MILESVVSSTNLDTRMYKVPFSLIEPAYTSSLIVLSTGIDSPVIGAWFKLELPSVIVPSKGRDHLV